MKHIIRYGDWKRLIESDSEQDQEMEDVRQLVDLGLVDDAELKSLYRQRYSVPRREEFLRLLATMFAELGIQPIDRTTQRQQRNGTYFFQLTPAQAERVLFEYPLPDGLAQSQEKRMRRMLETMRPNRSTLASINKVRTWKNWDGSQVTSNMLQYFVYPGDLRNAAYDGRPNSSSIVKFDGTQGAEAMLARLIYQIALDVYPWNPFDELLRRTDDK